MKSIGKIVTNSGYYKYELFDFGSKHKAPMGNLEKPVILVFYNNPEPDELVRIDSTDIMKIPPKEICLGFKAFETIEEAVDYIEDLDYPIFDVSGECCRIGELEQRLVERR